MSAEHPPNAPSATASPAVSNVDNDPSKKPRRKRKTYPPVYLLPIVPKQIQISLDIVRHLLPFIPQQFISFISKPFRVIANIPLVSNFLEDNLPTFQQLLHVRHCQGHLVGSVVWVTEQQDIDTLWNYGFFGKGVLSRSEPTWFKRLTNHRESGEVFSEEILIQRRRQRAKKKLEKKGILDSSIFNPESNPGEANNAEAKDDDDPIESEPLQNLEHLQLTPSEAFFLVYFIKSLTVSDPLTKQKILPLTLWKRFVQQSSSPSHLSLSPSPESSSQPEITGFNPFIIDYVAYHYFRSKKWVVKSGLKYGVDYVLYHKGPVYSHSEYAVLLIPTFEGQEEHGENQHSFQWLLGLNRVCSQVKKKILLCYVIVPPNLTTVELMSPEVIRKYRIKEVVIRRWVAGRNRD
ncbi:hypothetical protein BKA69DRAFT_1076102 [Paraphysoderma sedebokerense]|nr:hypothetical protein BKA69DRAFT_1076102 [Paraphysoderma sedebokerense]